MNCNNCGRENNQEASFCIGCGAPLNLNNQSVVNSVVTNNVQTEETKNANELFYNIVKWFFRIGAIIIAICVLVVVGSIFLAFNTEKVDDSFVEGQRDRYVMLGNKQIPTLFNIVDEYYICSMNSYNDGKKFIFNYCDSELDEDVIVSYLNELVRSYDFEYDLDNDDYTSIKYIDVNGGYEVFIKVYKPIGYIEYYMVMLEEENSI